MSTRRDQDLRRFQNCPKWCDGADHAGVAADLGEKPSHFGSVGELGGQFQVDIEKPTIDNRPGWPVVRLHGSDDDVFVPWLDGIAAWKPPYTVRFSSMQARAIAAMLLRAADRIDMTP